MHAHALQVSASKPKYETGAKASVSLKSRQKPKQSTWTLPANNDDDELINDEDLLTEEDKQRPIVPGKTWTCRRQYELQ